LQKPDTDFASGSTEHAKRFAEGWKEVERCGEMEIYSTVTKSVSPFERTRNINLANRTGVELELVECVCASLGDLLQGKPTSSWT